MLDNMEQIFYNFLTKYFFNNKSINFNDTELLLSDSKKFKLFLNTYIILTVLFFIFIWFSIDLKNTTFSIITFFFSLLSDIIAGCYILAFLIRNNVIKIYMWYFYAIIFLLFIPLISFIIFYNKIILFVVYYYFYLFFLILFFSLIPKIYFFLKNIRSCLLSIVYIWFFFFKSIFIKLDSHNIEKIVNWMYINKWLTIMKVKKHLNKQKNSFRIFWGIIIIYSIINLLFGVSLFDIFHNYINPFITKITEFILNILDWSKWLWAILEIVFILMYTFIWLGVWYLIINTLFLYLEIYFCHYVMKILLATIFLFYII